MIRTSPLPVSLGQGKKASEVRMISDLHHACNEAVGHSKQQSSQARTALHPVSCRSAKTVNDGPHPLHSSCRLRLAGMSSHAPLQRKERGKKGM